ncbi:hypothetical protein FB567DRAFT_524986 [Paraphoma chrysanthemicola]|uniref:Protein kinase domain-containing protein n=1 Tax=Paraphoma chrysanthemicola TaxID=798071 RepID=A0A8K0R4E9_9PLEO|nr:hypothetical protein FB567DRAFT_524986 [Paraphoma chrysanthemicola]
MTRAGTPKYCSPEAAKPELRNNKSDIWSLGVAVLKMVVTLKGMKGRTIESIDTFFSEHGSLRTATSGNIDGWPIFLAELQATQ